MDFSLLSLGLSNYKMGSYWATAQVPPRGYCDERSIGGMEMIVHPLRHPTRPTEAPHSPALLLEAMESFICREQKGYLTLKKKIWKALFWMLPAWEFWDSHSTFKEKHVSFLKSKGPSETGCALRIRGGVALPWMSQTHLRHVYHLKPAQDPWQLVCGHEGGSLNPHGLSMGRGWQRRESNKHVYETWVSEKLGRNPARSPGLPATQKQNKYCKTQKHALTLPLRILSQHKL